MSKQQGSSDDEYDLSLRLWSDLTPLKPVVSKLVLPVDDLAVMGEEVKGWKGRNQTVRRHYASLASSRVQTEQDAAAWLAATLEQLALAATRFGLDIEALFWIAQLGRAPQASMVPDPALVARAVQVGARIFIENYTLPEGNGVSNDADVESPVKTWYPSG